METVQQNGRFTLFSSKLHSNIYSILFDGIPKTSYIFFLNYTGNVRTNSKVYINTNRGG